MLQWPPQTVWKKYNWLLYTFEDRGTITPFPNRVTQNRGWRFNAYPQEVVRFFCSLPSCPVQLCPAVPAVILVFQIHLYIYGSIQAQRGLICCSFGLGFCKNIFACLGVLWLLKSCRIQREQSSLQTDARKSCSKAGVFLGSFGFAFQFSFYTQTMCMYFSIKWGKK